MPIWTGGRLNVCRIFLQATGRQLIHGTELSITNPRQTLPLSGIEKQALHLWMCRSKLNTQELSNACSCLSETYYQLAGTSSIIILLLKKKASTSRDTVNTVRKVT
jgi:hypothetical protein